jgi:CheY-like chemotaxis protein
MISPKTLDLNQLLVRLEKMVHRLAGEGVELLLRLDADPARVRVDPLQMEQVVLDLAVNACEAMDGSGALTLRTTNVKIDEDSLQPDYKVPSGPYVMLSLSHTGPAPDDETREHIFEPYFTVGKGDRLPGPGLATVYGILKQSGGYIEIGSEGLQPTYRVYLPAMQSADATQVMPAAAKTSLQGSETVLVVEDEDAVRGLACKVLRRAGYQVIEARGGSDALMMAQTHHGPIRLLVTDMMMAGMSGSDLAKAFRPLRPESRVLFLSGHWGGALVEDGLIDASAVFLQKPFTADQLLRMVRQVLDRPASG